MSPTIVEGTRPLTASGGNIKGRVFKRNKLTEHEALSAPIEFADIGSSPVNPTDTELLISNGSVFVP